MDASLIWMIFNVMVFEEIPTRLNKPCTSDHISFIIWKGGKPGYWLNETIAIYL